MYYTELLSKIILCIMGLCTAGLLLWITFRICVHISVLRQDAQILKREEEELCRAEVEEERTREARARDAAQKSATVRQQWDRERQNEEALEPWSRSEEDRAKWLALREGTKR